MQKEEKNEESLVNLCRNVNNIALFRPNA